MKFSKSFRALNLHKAHDHDDIFIRMINICDKLFLKPLFPLFQNSTELSHYADITTRSNIIPVHKKNNKEFDGNCRPISLLPILSKTFGKIIFNEIYHFLLQERPLNPNQSGLCTSGSCITQLLAIIHQIFQAFHCNQALEVRSVFLDKSKAFEVWRLAL